MTSIPELLLDIEAAIEPIPPADAYCHKNICPQDKCGRCGRIIQAHVALAALSARLSSPSVPEGYVIVRKTPNRAMFEAADALADSKAPDDVYLWRGRAIDLWTRMLSAAQPPSAPPEAGKFQCSARKCEWPLCECDPYVRKVLEEFHRQGFELVKEKTFGR